MKAIHKTIKLRFKDVVVISTPLFALAFMFLSCQEEIDITQGTDPNAGDNTNNYNSKTTSYFKRISMLDGAFDDILDQTSCSSVVLPVSITANGIPLFISSATDYALIETIFNQSNTDQDVVVFNFPIQIINYDYTTQTIANQLELNNLIQACNQLTANNEQPITCVALIYGIKISVFNTNLNQSTIITVASNQDLYNFINNLSPDEVYAIKYPIEVSITGLPTNTVVNSDNELENNILNCVLN